MRKCQKFVNVKYFYILSDSCHLTESCVTTLRSPADLWAIVLQFGISTVEPRYNIILWPTGRQRWGTIPTTRRAPSPKIFACLFSCPVILNCILSKHLPFRRFANFHHTVTECSSSPEGGTANMRSGSIGRT